MAQKNNDIIEKINQKIITSLENGVIPWNKPWKDSESKLPQNFISKKPYSGINFVLTNCNLFQSPYWLTYKQVRDLGGNVRKGEQATPIIFYKTLVIKDEDEKEEEKKIPLLRYFNVFNLDQVENIRTDVPVEILNDKESLMEHCPNVLESYVDCPEIRIGNYNRCSYSPADDTIRMHSPRHFESEKQYYSVLFHELVHSTGAKKRLSRDAVIGRDNSKEAYAKEELIAELGASYLRAFTGIGSNMQDESSASYIQGWLSALNNDKRFFFTQASQAKKAVSYILGEQS